MPEFEIRKEVVLPVGPEQVWQAVATPEGQAAWLFPAEQPPGATVEQEPPTRLAIRTPSAPDGSFHAFEYVIVARDDGTTVLRFVHSGFASDDWGDDFVAMTGHGWDMYLHTLSEYLTRFAGRAATYIDGEAPAGVAWAQVEKALGLAGPAAPGDRVRLTPSGLPPIDGVVDYTVPGEDFLGLRAGDALYRFHGRARLGMPVAVGHHLYGAVPDPDAVRHAWQAWLADLAG
jgi:uncharacterized protein YndB with AHSA1/START domain